MAPAIKNVADTAFLVAGCRALESERARPLFRDPLARKLAGDFIRPAHNFISAPADCGTICALRLVDGSPVIDSRIALPQRLPADRISSSHDRGSGACPSPVKAPRIRPTRLAYGREADLPHRHSMRDRRHLAAGCLRAARRSMSDHDRAFTVAWRLWLTFGSLFASRGRRGIFASPPRALTLAAYLLSPRCLLGTRPSMITPILFSAPIGGSKLVLRMAW